LFFFVAGSFGDSFTSPAREEKADFNVGTALRTLRDVIGSTSPLKDFAGTGPS
jgi:hypothetical protein